MKTILFLFLAILILSGCRTPTLITQTTTEIQYRDTTVYVEIPLYIDTTIFVTIPGFKDSVRIRDSVRIENGLAHIKPIHKNVGLIAVDVSIYNSQLSIDAYLTDSTILFNLKDTLNFQDSVEIFNAISEKVTTNSIILPPVKYIPKFYKFAFWLLIIELSLMVLFIIYKLNYFGIFGKLFSRLPFK